MKNLLNIFRNRKDSANAIALGTPARDVRPVAARGLALSPEALALEAINPLRGLGVSQAQDIFDLARRGNYSTLARLYEEIESADPTLLVVSERRTGALDGVDWNVRPADGRGRGFDEGLAREQCQAATALLGSCNGFAEAVEHLATAFFRGSAHLQPRWSATGSLLGFVHVPLAMVCYDKQRDIWQLNPTLSPETPGTAAAALFDIPQSDGMIHLVRRRHIDYPALLIYIRSALGERHWGRFVDRFGLPPAVLTMPAMASAEDEGKFLDAARAAADGRTVALPSGSGVSFASDARGVNPFSEYLRHQQELIVLMATGGLLTTLAESGSGTLAGGAHLDTWRQVVRRDARIIGDTLQSQLLAPWLRRMFPGKSICAVFEFESEEKPTAAQVLADAATARTAGYEMDAEELSTLTGYKLRVAPPTPLESPGVPAPLAPFQNARRDEAKTEEILRGLLSDLDEPLLEGMAREIAAEDAQDARGGNPDNPGQFSEEEGAHGESEKARQKREKRERQAKNCDAGRTNYAKVQSGEDCRDFMQSEALGRIAFYQGSEHEGYLHIVRRAAEDAGHAEMLRGSNIPDTLAYGKYYPDNHLGQKAWSVVGSGGKCVVLGTDSDGVKIITAYKLDANKQAVFARLKAIENAEVVTP